MSHHVVGCLLENQKQLPADIRADTDVRRVFADFRTASVTWSGTTGSQVIKNNSWHVEVFYIPLFRGSSANADGETSSEGTVDFRKDAPFRFTGLYFVLGLLFLYLTGREIAHGPGDPLPAQLLP